MFNHRQWRKLLVPYTLGELPEGQKAELETHLSSCPGCLHECAVLRAVNICAEGTTADEPSEPVLRAARERVRMATLGASPENLPQQLRRGRPWQAMVARRGALAAAAAFLLAAGLWLSGLGQSGRAAYALGQTSEALAAKQSLHVKVWFPDGRLKEEFWAEFKADGTTRRFRQEEDDQVTVWADNVKTRYFANINLLRLTRSNGQENVLEQTDPQLMVQRLLQWESEGKAVIEAQWPTHEQPHIAVTATDPAGKRFRQTLLVDPKTLLVKKILEFRVAGEGWALRNVIEVAEYNQPLSAELFRFEAPSDAVTADQVSQTVGVTQDELTEEELAVQLASAALEAWKKGNLPEAARLFGGIDVRCLSERLATDRPVDSIQIEKPVPVGMSHWPRLEVPCQYTVDRGTGLETVQRVFTVVEEPVWQKVDDQPARWWIDPADLIHVRRVEAVKSEAGLEQGQLSNEQIAVQIVREFFEAVMAEDYGTAARLAGGIPAEQLGKRFSDRRIVRIISISDPQVHEGRPDHFRVAFEIEVESGGNRQIVADEFSVEPVEDQPGRWEID